MATSGHHPDRKDHHGWSHHHRGRPCRDDDLRRRWKPNEEPHGPWGKGGQGPRSTEDEGPAPRRVPDRLSRHGELFKEQLVPHGMEGGKGNDPLDESLQVAVAEAGAEATQKVQHQGAVDDRLAEVAEGVCHALHLAAVLPHGEIPMRELMELGVEVKGLRVPVHEELVLQGEPSLSTRVRLVTDDVL
jgi:hypothetical protein